MNHSLSLLCALIDDALHDLYQVKPRGSNPYEGQCYVASATLKKFFGRSLMLYRTKDHRDRYHWWIETKEGQVIDLTMQQYILTGHPVPSDAENAVNKEKQYYLNFSSYKKRIEELTAFVNQKLSERATESGPLKVRQ